MSRRSIVQRQFCCYTNKFGKVVDGLEREHTSWSISKMHTCWTDIYSRYVLELHLRVWPINHHALCHRVHIALSPGAEKQHSPSRLSALLLLVPAQVSRVHEVPQPSGCSLLFLADTERRDASHTIPPHQAQSVTLVKKAMPAAVLLNLSNMRWILGSRHRWVGEVRPLGIGW